MMRLLSSSALTSTGNGNRSKSSDSDDLQPKFSSLSSAATVSASPHSSPNSLRTFEEEGSDYFYPATNTAQLSTKSSKVVGKSQTGNENLPKEVQLLINTIEAAGGGDATSLLQLGEKLCRDEVVYIKRTPLNPIFYFVRYKQYTQQELLTLGTASKLAASSVHVKYGLNSECSGSVEYLLYHAKYSTRRPTLKHRTDVLDANGHRMTIEDLYRTAIQMDLNCVEAWFSLAKLLFRNDSASQSVNNDGWNITTSNFHAEVKLQLQPNTTDENVRRRSAEFISVEVADHLCRFKSALDQEQRSYANYLKYYYDRFLEEEERQAAEMHKFALINALAADNDFPVYLAPVIEKSAALSKSNQHKRKKSIRLVSSLGAQQQQQQQQHVQFQLDGRAQSMPTMRPNVIGSTADQYSYPTSYAPVKGTSSSGSGSYYGNSSGSGSGSILKKKDSGSRHIAGEKPLTRVRSMI